MKNTIASVSVELWVVPSIFGKVATSPTNFARAHATRVATGIGRRPSDGYTVMSRRRSIGSGLRMSVRNASTHLHAWQ